MTPYTLPLPAHGLTATVYASIRDVPREQWDGLLRQASSTFSTALWEAVEEGRLNDFDYRHVLLRDAQGAAVGLASYYAITTDIAIFAPPVLRAALGAIRRAWPNFLKVRMLECGTPITINSPPFAAPEAQGTRVMAALTEVMRQAARTDKPFILIMRDFEPNADALWPVLKREGYHAVDSLPNTYLDIVWASPEAYLQSMKSYYRSKLLRNLKINAAQGVSHELVDDFADLADTLCAQWRTVHDQADEFQREILTPEFYRAFSQHMGARSKALLFYRNGELAGHALLLMDGDLLRWLYIGRERAANDSLYIYAAHKVVETAIRLGAKRLELGLTTYSIKQDLGAQMTPIRLALRARWGLINPFVGLGYTLLNRTPGITRKDIFKRG